MGPKFRGLSWAAAALLALCLAAPAKAAEAPQTLIDGFHASLLDVMKKADALGYDGRRRELGRSLTAVFHLPVMARIVVGSQWRKLSADQRTKMVDAFSRMTIATYANRFDGYENESFRILGVEPVRDKTVLVKTQIVRTRKEPVGINYLMREFSDGWRVIDVFLKDAYSELATRRSEYSSIIRREGFDALIRQIEAKIAEFGQRAG